MAFLHEMKTRDHYNKSLMECSFLLLRIEPNLITNYVKFTFSNTKVTDVLAVSESLSRIGKWFKALLDWNLKLPKSFDCNFFSIGIDMIIGMDHYQTLPKLLALIYNFSEIFTHQQRKSIFGEILITKRFFELFLHWDVNIRHTFHQLIIFRMLRADRGRLQKKGFKVGELEQKENEDNVTIKRKRRKISKSDFATDTLLFSLLEERLKQIHLQAVNENKKEENLLFPVSLEVYVPTAIYEYKRFLSTYWEWELSGQDKVPELKPIPLLIHITRQNDG